MSEKGRVKRLLHVTLQVSYYASWCQVTLYDRI